MKLAIIMSQLLFKNVHIPKMHWKEEIMVKKQESETAELWGGKARHAAGSGDAKAGEIFPV